MNLYPKHAKTVIQKSLQYVYYLKIQTNLSSLDSRAKLNIG
jgi:hypothetical protein